MPVTLRKVQRASYCHEIDKLVITFLLPSIDL